MPATAAANSESKDNTPVLKIPELLAPAGSSEKLVTALHYGADAVYCGGRKFSLRAHAANFSDRELAEAVQYVHDRKKKLYVTVNIFARQQDLHGLESYLKYLGEIGVDGIIVADPGILALAREIVPEVPLHLSTQANVTNPASARFWEAQGAARLNLARELSLAEIRKIRAGLAPETQAEVFVHGSLCISYSGRCLLSCYFTGRDANRGDCAHPCRYRYALLEEKRPGRYFPVEEDEHGTYIFNAKDLCLLPWLPQLVSAGVDSLKIEGRMKSVYYVGGVVRVYRAALDFIARESDNNLSNISRVKLPPVYMAELAKVGTRGYTANFINGPPGPEAMLYDRSRTDQEYAPVGLIRGFGAEAKLGDRLEIEVRNPFRKGDRLEYLGRDIQAVSFEAAEVLDQDNLPLPQANPGNIVKVQYKPAAAAAWEVNGLLRKKIKAG